MKLNKAMLLGFDNGTERRQPMVGGKNQIQGQRGPAIQVEQQVNVESETDTDLVNRIADNAGQEQSDTDSSNIA